MQRRSSHLKSIELVARRLSSLNSLVVFTGGAVVGLLLTDPAAPDVYLSLLRQFSERSRFR